MCLYGARPRCHGVVKGAFRFDRLDVRVPVYSISPWIDEGVGEGRV